MSSSRRDASRQGNICKFGRANNLVSDTSRSPRMCGLIVIYRETRCLAETKVETACYRGNYRKGDRLGRSRMKKKKRVDEASQTMNSRNPSEMKSRADRTCFSESDMSPS